MTTHIITVNYDDTPVFFQTDAFINATAIGKKFHKSPKDYLKSNRTKDYIDSIRRNLLIEENQLVIVRGGAPELGGGTWLHPKLAIDFARWLSADFAVWCDMQIESILQQLHAPKPPVLQPKPLPSEQLIEHDRDRVVLIREIAAKTRAFRRCRNRLERESLASCLMSLNNMAGFLHLNAMILEELPLAALPLAPDCDSGDVLKQFWYNYTILSGAERLNHSRHRGEIAINIKEFTLACQREGLALADASEIYTCLPLSQLPYPVFVKANYSLGSALIKNKVLKCWHFKTISDGVVL